MATKPFEKEKSLSSTFQVAARAFTAAKSPYTNSSTAPVFRSRQHGRHLDLVNNRPCRLSSLATIVSIFFHQVWSISLISFLLADAAIRQQSALESCAIWVLAVLAGAFCLALSPLQLFIFKFRGAYEDSRLPDTWEPHGREGAKDPSRPPISAEYVSNRKLLRVYRASLLTAICYKSCRCPRAWVKTRHRVGI